MADQRTNQVQSNMGLRTETKSLENRHPVKELPHELVKWHGSGGREREGERGGGKVGRDAGNGCNLTLNLQLRRSKGKGWRGFSC